MESQQFIDVISQVPSLSVLVYITLQFLRRQKEMSNDFSEAFKGVQKQTHEINKEVSDVIKQNTIALTKVHLSIKE